MRIFLIIIVSAALCGLCSCSKTVISSDAVEVPRNADTSSTPPPSPLAESELSDSPLPPTSDYTGPSASPAASYSPYDEPGYYTYQVGQFQGEIEAQVLAQRLTDNGFLVDVEEQNGQYVVVAGHSGTDTEIRNKLSTLGVDNPTHRPFSGLSEATDTHGQTPPAAAATAGMLFFQVGSFSKPENAQIMRSSLEQQGFTTFIEPVAVSGMTQNRVIAGMQGDEDSVRRQLAQAGIYTPVRYNGTPPANLDAPAGTAPQQSFQPAPAAPAPAAAPAMGMLTFQVGSFSKRDNGQTLADMLSAAGFQTSIETVNVGGSWVYRVLASAQGSESELRNRLAAYDIHDAVLRRDVQAPAAAPAPTPPTAATPAIVTPQPASGSTMLFQAAAFSRMDNATSLQQGLIAHGLDSYVEEVPTQSGLTQYRVVVRHSGDEQQIRRKLYELGITDPVLLP